MTWNWELAIVLGVLLAAVAILVRHAFRTLRPQHGGGCQAFGCTGCRQPPGKGIAPTVVSIDPPSEKR